MRRTKERYDMVNLKCLFTAAAAAAIFTVPAAVYAAEPADIVFTQEPDGKYIYCNNHEVIRTVDLADNSVRNPKYIMNNEELTADNYSMFLSFSNRTDITTNTNLESFTAEQRGFDIEVDVMFKAREDTVITLKRLGFEVPEHRDFFLNGTEYSTEDEWGCFYCWASYLGMPIRQINSGNAYYGDPIEETTIEIKAGEIVWLSDYIDNYREVPFCRSVNIMADFTIESGVCDVNVAAVRSNGELKNRDHVNKSPGYGSYYRDKQYKGISDGMNEVTAELSYTIDDSEASGTLLPVTVYNKFEPEGNTLTEWYTHLNPSADPWSYALCAESDMISMTYYDPLKLTYYGSDVPEEERDAYYVFDTEHTDTAAYESEYGSRSDYVPNRLLEEGDSNDLACNLGNYGVIYNYKIKITNNGNKHRYLTYRLRNSSNNVVYVKDSEGNVINGYALCKGYRSESVTDNMACMSIPAQTTSEYTVCVILTPNYPGGMANSLMLTDYPQIIETYETERSGIEKDRFFTGREYYKWDLTTLMLSNDRENWHSVTLPDKVANEIRGNANEYSLTYTGDGYLLRPSLYDAGVYSHADSLFRTVYLLDENFALRSSYTFGSYPQSCTVANGVYYVETSGTVFRSNGFYWWDIVQMEMPCWNYGRFSAVCENGVIKLSADGENFDEVKYLGFKPDYIDSYGEYYYFTDGRALYLSENGIYWEGIIADETIKTFEIRDDMLIINGSEEHELPEIKETVVIKYNGTYIGTEHEPLLTDGTTYVPLRELAELMGAEVEWNDGLITLTSGKEEAVIDTAAKIVSSDGTETGIQLMIQDGTTYVPVRQTAALLGCTVDYDEDTNTAELVK